MTDLGVKSNNLIDGILQLVELLKQTNEEIDMKINSNNAEAENSRQRIEQIGVDNKDLERQKESNEAFINDITALIEKFKAKNV